MLGQRSPCAVLDVVLTIGTAISSVNWAALILAVLAYAIINATPKHTIAVLPTLVALLSMTGLFGSLGFAMLAANVVSSLFTSMSAVPRGYKDVLRGWVAFFSVHLIIEGYIFACGSLLCFLFWLTVGCTTSLQHQGRRIQLQQQILRRSRIQRKSAAA